MGIATERRILELMREGTPFVAGTVIEAENPALLGAKALALAGGALEGTTGSAAVDAAIASGAAQALETGAKVVEAGGAKIFLDPHSPEPALVIAGAGHIAIPLAKFARELGYSVIVVDDREDMADPERFPGCEVRVGEFSATLDAIPYGPHTAAVVITRGHTFDIDCLLAILKRDAGYVGLIGSRRRVGFVKKELLAQGIPAERVASLFTPIGLDIGGESPAEIAISILAEMIALRRLGRAKTLSLRNRGETP